MSKKTLYISGPISNNPEAHGEFALAQIKLEQLGFKVINPFDLIEGLDLDPKRDYEKIMRIDVAAMVEDADEVVTLLGWDKSLGAKREVDIARLMNMPVVSVTKYLTVC